jgi:multicomponent Na+:H+ antiporter subunit G
VTEAITSFLLILGSGFMLLAAVGILRMPDLFSRMQAATKTSTLGAGSMFLGVAVFYGDLGIVSRSLLVIAFMFLTLPVSAHMIARAAYFDGVPLWKGTIVDELSGEYNPETHELSSKRFKVNDDKNRIVQTSKDSDV